MVNTTDICLYLSHAFPSYTGAHAPAGSNRSAVGLNASSHPGTAWVAAGDPLLESVKYLLVGVVNPTLCAFGLVGNLFNVLVMSRRRIKAAMSGTPMERSAYIGLVSLAVSDALYCLSGLLEAGLGKQQTVFRRREFVRMYGQLFRPYFQNMFMHTGCWLTVIMAAGRYAAICRPLRVSELASSKVRLSRIIVEFLASE